MMGLKRARFLLTFIVFGYAFLYLPIVSVIAFSFNESKIVNVWTGFSFKWYRALIHNEVILKAAGLSIQIAFTTALIAILIGTIAAIVIVRFRTFKGRSFFNSLVTAPLVMPDVMVGLALLLLFVMLYQFTGWPEIRGATTIIIGHATIAIAYVILIVRARLVEFDYSLEEAALDLGARPLTVFFKITLPLVMPSIAAGGLLAFTLSFDDVILASFLSGPGSTTLPMVIFSSVRHGISPEINALATIIITLVSISVILTGVSMHRRLKNANKIKRLQEE
jgi:putrescine transport system permease protein